MRRKRDEIGRFVKEDKADITRNWRYYLKIGVLIILALMFGYPWFRFLRGPIRNAIDSAVDEFDRQSCPNTRYTKDNCFRFLKIKLNKDFVPPDLVDIDRDYNEFDKNDKLNKEDERRNNDKMVRNKAEQILLDLKAQELASKLNDLDRKVFNKTKRDDEES
jgi:hypothetical protein